MFKENVSAFENMKVNLLANRLVPEKIPLVIQYNKRDLPDLLSESEFNKSLNPWQRPSFAAVATKGDGVMDTFVSIVEQMLSAIAVKYSLKDKGLDPAQVPELVAAAFRKRLQEAGPPPPAGAAAPEAASHARIIMSQAPDSAPVSAAPAATDGSLVAEDLLHRAIRSNVELAEALGDLIREINEGLGRVLSGADFLLTQRDVPPDKRVSTTKAIQDEALRLRSIVHGLGRRVAEAKPGESRSAPPPPSGPASPAAAPSAAPAGMRGMELLVRGAILAAQPILSPRGLSVDVRVTPGTPTPRGPGSEVERVVVSLLTGLARVASPGGAMLRCEKKPVLLKSSSGETRRDFVMIAVANGGGPSEVDQQRVLQGGDPGPMGETYRLVRGMGGFMRFAPLAGGGVETRLFLPEV
jgi:hypothetical protein